MVGVKDICALLLAGGIGAGSVVTVQEAVPAVKKASSGKAAKPAGRPAARHASTRPTALADCPSQLGLLGRNMVLPPLSPIDVAPGLPLGETAMGIVAGMPGGGGGIPGLGGDGIVPGPGDGGGIIPGIPEADTWAMLIAGFGLIGLALRRSGRAQPDA